jgi:DNA-binding HxlR family transcriptional regulator
LGIISYQINPKDKKVKEYFLTEKGIDLYPLIYELQRWSIKHVEFEFTDNTKNWNRQLQTKSQKEIVSDYTSNYLNFRKNHFGF